jgi:hypothetical protein
MPNNYTIFEDRTISLLERWRLYMVRNPHVTPQDAIEYCLQEINDGFTKSLMEG